MDLIRRLSRRYAFVVIRVARNGLRVRVWLGYLFSLLGKHKASVG